MVRDTVRSNRIRRWACFDLRLHANDASLWARVVGASEAIDIEPQY